MGFLTGPYGVSELLATKEPFAELKIMSLPSCLLPKKTIMLVSCKHLALRYTGVKTNTGKFEVAISWDFSAKNLHSS